MPACRLVRVRPLWGPGSRLRDRHQGLRVPLCDMRSSLRRGSTFVCGPRVRTPGGTRARSLAGSGSQGNPARL